MDRRTFLSATSLALLAAPLAAEAQQPGKRIPRVGVVWGVPSNPITFSLQEAFL